jgi:small subunit ribosomal protein S19
MAEQKTQIDLRKKEFTYRGKTINELKAMEVREFAKLVKSNERRALLRQTSEIQKFVARSQKEVDKKKPIRTHLREIIIVPQMIGWVINIHTGKEFVPVEIIGEMLGHRLGEFAVTRQKVKHGAAGIGATRSSASASVK